MHWHPGEVADPLGAPLAGVVPARFVIGDISVFAREGERAVLGCLTTTTPFVLDRREIAKRRMPSLVVVEDLDVLEDAGLRFGPGLVVLVVS